jgi:hypothetical protein
MVKWKVPCLLKAAKRGPYMNSFENYNMLKTTNKKRHTNPHIPLK